MQLPSNLTKRHCYKAFLAEVYDVKEEHCPDLQPPDEAGDDWNGTCKFKLWISFISIINIKFYSLGCTMCYKFLPSASGFECEDCGEFCCTDEKCGNKKKKQCGTCLAIDEKNAPCLSWFCRIFKRYVYRLNTWSSCIYSRFTTRSEFPHVKKPKPKSKKFGKCEECVAFQEGMRLARGRVKRRWATALYDAHIDKTAVERRCLYFRCEQSKMEYHW
jgi:hypothetical protein